MRTAQEHEVGLIRRRASNPTGSQRDRFVGGFDSAQIGAVRCREIVRRAGFSGKKESAIHRSGEGATRVRIAGKRVRIGSLRQRIARPAGFDERAHAGAKSAAEQFDKLSDREIEKGAGSRGLELAQLNHPGGLGRLVDLKKYGELYKKLAE